MCGLSVFCLFALPIGVIGTLCSVYVALPKHRRNIEGASLGVFWSICACLVLSDSSSFSFLGRAAACDCSTHYFTYKNIFVVKSANGLI